MSDYKIHTLDLDFLNSPEGIAAFLVIGPGGPVLVECGPGSCLPALQRELGRHGVAAEDVQDVLVTHIHLDHSGSAGWWAQQGARIHVHHVGAPHLIEPSKLLASAQRIYGDHMEPLWGEYLASPAGQVNALRNGDAVEAAGLIFTALETPGHARHHLVYQLDDVAFCGDLAGIRLSGRPHTRMPTPPPEFNLEDWLASLDLVRRASFRQLYLTHFGALDDPAGQWDLVERLLRDAVDFVRGRLAAGADRNAVIAGYVEREQARERADGLDDDAIARYSGVGPFGMSVDGLLRYWAKRGLAARDPAP